MCVKHGTRFIAQIEPNHGPSKALCAFKYMYDVLVFSEVNMELRNILT